MSALAISTIQSSGERHLIQQELIQWLANTVGRSRITLLEIGSFEGQSALNWSNAIAQHCPDGGAVLCVDPWKPYHTEALLKLGGLYVQMDSALRDGTVYRNFLQNTALANPRAPLSWLKGTLEEVYPQVLEDWGRFDVVFIDGDHRASVVAKDIFLSKLLVKDGGLLCGDDHEQAWEACDQGFTLEQAEVTDYTRNYHPGVTLAVWQEMGRVWSRSGTWAMQRANGAWVEPKGGVL